ncbi:MAG: hypothetical protein LUI60_01195 [Clostridia bacterium]|nr:hypothetical protein [Clostridia bacterium]
MKRRTKILSLLAAAAVTGTTVLSGCSLVSTVTQADMEQVIATVDISQSDELDSTLSAYTWAITNTEISKRDLVAYFVNVGYSYVSDGTTTYGEAFEQIAEALVNNEILIQYAVMSTLYEMVNDETYTSITSASQAESKFNSFESETDLYKWLLEYQAGVINDANGTSIDYSLLCEYTLYKSINSSIDTYEEDFLDTEDDSDSSTATLPTNVDTEVDDYYPVDSNGNLDYGVYTGYSSNLIDQSGQYSEDKLEGSTIYSRAYAYNQYIQVLDANYLILDGEDTTKVYELNYVQSQYLDLLREQVVSNFYEIYEIGLEEDMSANNYEYVKSRYEELLAQQTAGFNDADTFSSALSNMSSSSFLLYTPDTGTFGYVYNILAPFSAAQTSQLTALSADLSNDVIDDYEYYFQRNKLLKEVTTTDQRSSWFNGGVDYSFDAYEYYYNLYVEENGSDAGFDATNYYYGNSTTLFFENNLTNNSRYEELENYYGKYTFNGTAILNDDGETYTIIANTLDIEGLIGEFRGYINWVMGGNDVVSIKYYNDNKEDFYKNRTKADFTSGYSGETDGVIDYSKFIYATGKVDFGTEEFSMADLTNINSNYYKVMSAVNELQYAYTTDTSILSTYVGYSLDYTDEGSSGYVLEFEYAAKDAIDRAASGTGAGTYCVVATDYGWHIIYVTATLTAGSNTYTPDWTRVTTEGTFEYNFYELLKTSDLENASSAYQQNLVIKYYNDTCVTMYEDRYEDLTSLTTTAS